MSITSPTPTRLTLMDRAVITYHSMGENFLDLLDFYLSCHPEAERHIRTGPNYFLLFRKDGPEDDPYWLIDYFGGSGNLLARMMEFMPYYLDRVAFVRYAKYRDKELRFIKTDKLIKYYGIKTEIAASTASASTSTSTAYPSSSDSDQASRNFRQDGEPNSSSA